MFWHPISQTFIAITIIKSVTDIKLTYCKLQMCVQSTQQILEN